MSKLESDRDFGALWSEDDYFELLHARFAYSVNHCGPLAKPFPTNKLELI